MTLTPSQRESLTQLDSGRLLFDEPMSRHTSFRIGGPADAWLKVKDPASLGRVLAWCKAEELRWYIQGGGCNLLVRDGGIRGVVLVLGKGFAGIEAQGLEEEGGEQGDVDAVNRFAATEEALLGRGQELPVLGDSVSLRVGAATSIPRLLKFCVQYGLKGLEGLAGVPGSLGGALVMNAGTHEGEIGAAVDSLEWVTRDGELRQAPGDRFKWEYRQVNLPPRVILTAAVLRLTAGSSAEVAESIATLNEYRKSTQPKGVPSAGCVFRNPKGADPAGRILDELGFKGVRVRGIQVSPVHANYLVNTGAASAKDVLAVLRMIQSKVQKERGIKLETELRIVGEEPNARESRAKRRKGWMRVLEGGR